MEQGIGGDAESKLIAILRILSESSEPLGSITIARKLEHEGVFLSERAVRYHLKIADERGFTEPGGRDGRLITPAGQQEVKEALASQHLGFVREKLELLAYETTFNPKTRTGLLPINSSFIPKAKFKKAVSVMRGVFDAGLCVSDLVAVASEGDKLGSAVVPEGYMGCDCLQRGDKTGCTAENPNTYGFQVRRGPGDKKLGAEAVRGNNRLCRHLARSFGTVHTRRNDQR